MFYFCLQSGQINENRMNTGLAGRPEALIHNVIHSSCGYPEKLNEIRGLVALKILDRRLQA
jgi:hypothetical protein